MQLTHIMVPSPPPPTPPDITLEQWLINRRHQYGSHLYTGEAIRTAFEVLGTGNKYSTERAWTDIFWARAEVMYSVLGELLRTRDQNYLEREKDFWKKKETK